MYFKYENTDKEFTLEAIANELDWNDSMQVGFFINLSREIRYKGISGMDKILICRDLFMNKWLLDNSLGIIWLINHSFLKEKEPEFLPFWVEVKTLEEAKTLSLSDISLVNLVRQIPAKYRSSSSNPECTICGENDF